MGGRRFSYGLSLLLYLLYLGKQLTQASVFHLQICLTGQLQKLRKYEVNI